MLRKIRLTLASLFFVGVSLLFLDFTGVAHAWLAWMAQIQFLPALLAANGLVIIALVILTLLLGRVYCSVICPLGILQDIMAWIGRRGKRKKAPYKYSCELRWLRWGVLMAFVGLFAFGLQAVAWLVAPYSVFGRIASSLFAPVYRLGNNLLATVAERYDSYAFYSADVWMKSLPTFFVALATFVLLFILAWRGGRTWCNTICPVGTVLGYLSRFSLLKIRIDESKCNRCGRCSKKCKASCIDSKHHNVDYSRCVACMNCLYTCKHGAISLGYGPVKKHKTDKTVEDNSRRTFITTTAVMAVTAAVEAQEKKVDGGLAVVEDKAAPNRATPVLPPGSLSAHHLARNCT